MSQIDTLYTPESSIPNQLYNLKDEDSEILRKIKIYSKNIKTCYSNFTRSILDELVDREREFESASSLGLKNHLTVIIDNLRILYESYIGNIDYIEEEKKLRDNNHYLDFLINIAAPNEDFKKMVNIRNFYMVLLMGDVNNIEGYEKYAYFLKKYTKSNSQYDSDYDRDYFKNLYAKTFEYIKEHYQKDVNESNYFYSLYDPDFKHPTLKGGRSNKSNYTDMNIKYVKELCKANKIKLSTTKNEKRVIYTKKELLTKLKRKKII